MIKTADPVIAGIVDGRRAFTGPEHVVIDLTNRCNMRCIACWTYSPLLKERLAAPEWQNQELDFEVVKRLIDDLATIGTRRIRFTGGGEPFLHSKIIDLIEYAKNRGLICAVTTNGTLLSKDLVKKIVKIGLDDLAVSLWAGDDETYARLHPNASKEIFSRIRESLLFLASIKNHRPRLLLCNVICNLNYMGFRKMVKFAADVKADAVYFTHVDIIDGGTDGLLLANEDMNLIQTELAGVKELAKENDIELENIDEFEERLYGPNSKNGEYDRGRIGRMPCYIGWLFARILANGDVAPCCRAVHKPMGNITNSDFKEIWFSTTYDEFRSMAKEMNMKKIDPYFAEIGCLKMCDNFIHNETMQRGLGVA